MDGNKSLAAPLLNNLNKSDLQNYFVNSWNLYEKLLKTVTDKNVFYQNPDPLRHPLVFYLGHTAAFYINKLVLAGVLDKGIHSEFETLFATGVDPEVPEDLPTNIKWPTLNAVYNYRQEVYEVLINLFQQFPKELSINPQNPLWAMLMGIEHERIHFETTTVLMRQLPVTILARPIDWDYAENAPVHSHNEFIEINSGTVEIGKKANVATYGWDNEYGYLKVEVPRFATSKNLITNDEFMHFVAEGGYKNPDYWSSQGWQWVQRYQVKSPKFWIHKNGNYGYRALFDEIDMPNSWPAEVNFYEAEAYCRWKGDHFRLMTEPEFNLMAQNVPLINNDIIQMQNFNNNLKFFSPTPVGFFTHGKTTEGINDVYGNVWQWVNNNFYPLPGFRVHSYYDDFSTPYFGAHHAMLLGGSWATTGTALSKYYRLWFRRNFFQHAGFRVVKMEK